MARMHHCSSAACSSEIDKLDIRLFMEEAKTSQFVQPPDVR